MQRLRAQEHSYLTENIVKSFNQNRIFTLIDFLQEDVEKLSTLGKLSLPQVLEIRNYILAKYSAPTRNGLSLFVNRITSNEFISTRINSLDMILSNGIPTGYITEICGLAGCGKSQLCFQLAINCVQNTSNIVIYIDTKGDFSAVRIQKILDACGFSHKEMAFIMLKIKVIRVWHMEELIKLFEEMNNGIVVHENLSLIIIDSLPSLMFQHFGDESKIGLKLLNNFVSYARRLGKKMEIAVVCINIQTRWIEQDVAEPEDDGQTYSTTKDHTYYNERLNRCLGKYWQTVPLVVMFMEKYQNSNENNCSAIKVTVMKHNNPQTLNKYCMLEINSYGIR